MFPARKQCKMCQWALETGSKEDMHPACAKYACPGCVANPKRAVYNILNFRNRHGFLCDSCDLDTVGILTVRTVVAKHPADPEARLKLNRAITSPLKLLSTK